MYIILFIYLTLNGRFLPVELNTQYYLYYLHVCVRVRMPFIPCVYVYVCVCFHLYIHCTSVLLGCIVFFCAASGVINDDDDKRFISDNKIENMWFVTTAYTVRFIYFFQCI